MSSHLFSYDIKAQYEAGIRLFENAEISYAQMENFDFSGVIFKNCKFNSRICQSGK